LNRYTETVGTPVGRSKGLPGPGRDTTERGILGGVSGRLVVWGVLVAAGSVAAFLLLVPILATFVAVVGACLWLLALLSSTWDQHPSFEQRELERARRRAAHRERTKEARARDRARWEAHQQRRSGR